MKTKMLVLGAFIAGILSAFFGGKAFATAGNTAEISSGTWEICVNATLDTQSPDFSLDITKSGFESQLVLGGGECKTVKLTGSSAYTVSLGSTMGASSVDYEVSEGSLTFNVANSLNNYLNAFGSVTYTTEGSGEESDFELLFSMPGTCYLNGNANVSGETCADGDGNPLTDRKYIDTGVALFSEGNAARDFEIYFTLDDYASTQPNNQGTLFNAKYENSSMYYPGFTLRMSGSDVQKTELTGRIGNDNTAADKATKYISTASLKGKEMKIVRVGGLVSYSIDGGELIEFQNYQNFSRYFEQNAVFGASLQPNGTPQRYYDGTISNIRIYLKKVGSIEFNANGGTGTMATIENAQLGANVTLPANTFTREGYDFDGWNTAADGTGADYADEAEVAIISADTLTLYAQWIEQAPTGSIEFDANGGTGTMNAISEIELGTDVTLPANTFTREGYEFAGWNTAADDTGTDYADEAEVTITSTDTLMLYAQWEELPKGRIEFDANGGIGTMAAIEGVVVGTSATLPANEFERTNYSFEGWNTAADGTGANYTDEAEVTITSTDTLTLYAQWEELRGSIMFNANGGTGTMSAISEIELGTDVTLPANTFTRSGYDFSGWNTKASGSGASYVDGGSVTIVAEEPLILFAQWQKKQVGKIALLANGGSGSMASINNIEPGTDVTLPINTYSLSGASFLGWNTATDGSGISYADGATITVSNAETIRLYAQWSGTSATLTYGYHVNTRIKTLAAGSSVTNPEAADDLVKNIEFVKTLPSSISEDTPKVDISYSPGYGIPIYAYWVASDGAIYIYTEAERICASYSIEYLFSTFTALESLAIPDYFTTSKTTKMRRVFYNDSSLLSLTLPNSLDTSNATDMSWLFYRVEALTSLVLPDSFDTSNVTDMNYMFYNMQSLTSLTLPDNFDTSNVTDMGGMFSGMRSLTSLTLPNSFDTSNVTRMSSMFSGMRSLTSLTLPNSFNTQKVTYMNFMFGSMTSLTSLTFPSKGFDTSSVVNMSSMFYNTSSLTSLTLPDNFDTSGVTDMSYMFYNMTSLASLTLPDKFVIKSGTNTDNMTKNIPTTATLYASDATARSLWPGVLGN